MTAAQDVKPLLLDVRAAAAYSSVSTRLIYEWLNAGLIEGRVIGKRKRVVLRESLDAYLLGLPQDPPA